DRERGVDLGHRPSERRLVASEAVTPRDVGVHAGTRPPFDEEGAAGVEQDGAQRRHGAALRAEWRAMKAPRKVGESSGRGLLLAVALQAAGCGSPPPAAVPPEEQREAELR